MKQYYYNPVGGDLIILDVDKQDVQVIERIEKVKVWVKGEVRLGDFDGPNSGPATDDVANYQNGHFDPKIGKVKEWNKKPRICKACGKPGHRSDNCPSKTSTV